MNRLSAGNIIISGRSLHEYVAIYKKWERLQSTNLGKLIDKPINPILSHYNLVVSKSSQNAKINGLIV